MQASRVPVLLIGASDFHEFGEAVDWLRAHTQLVVVRTVADALQLCAEPQAFWHTLVIAQSRPGEFSQRDIDRLGRALPLAHLIALLGSCCEGEPHSDRPWPGVVRVYWHQFAARAETELPRDHAGTSWQLPRTATDAERTDCALLSRPARAEGLIAICTRQAVFFDALASVCRAVGYSSVWMAAEQWWSVQGAAAMLWHGPAHTDDAFGPLRKIALRSRHVPVIALLGFPRFDQVQDATAAGAAAVLALPFHAPDLWNLLRKVTR